MMKKVVFGTTFLLLLINVIVTAGNVYMAADEDLMPMYIAPKVTCINKLSFVLLLDQINTKSMIYMNVLQN